jgi:hypothetical protein
MENKTSEYEDKVRAYWVFVALHEYHGCFSVLYGSPIAPRGGDTGSIDIDWPWKLAYDYTIEHEKKVNTAKAAIRELVHLQNKWGDVPQLLWLQNLATNELFNLLIGVRTKA